MDLRYTRQLSAADVGTLHHKMTPEAADPSAGQITFHDPAPGWICGL